MTKFFSRLRYSFGNEDWRTENQALNIQASDHVLCITASGDRPLNLLVNACEKMICLDANPIQNFLLELKVAALSLLNYEDYLAFLGATKERGMWRNKILQQLLPSMSPGASLYWKKNKKMVEKGVLYQGTMEQFLKIVAKFFHLFRGKKIEKLFAFKDIEAQRKFLNEEWKNNGLRKIFNFVVNTCLLRTFIRDPGLVNYSSKIKPGNYIYDRINASLERELANKNLLLSLILRAKVSSEAFSPYLTHGADETIKERLSCIEMRTMDIISYLEALPGPTFDVFSLSDVASYISYSDFIRLLKGMIKTAKPGARFCLRQFLSFYEIPADLKDYFARNNSLEKHLEDTDNCFVYRFMVGTIATVSALEKKDEELMPSEECSTDFSLCR